MTSHRLTTEAHALLARLRQHNRGRTKEDYDQSFAALPPMPYGIGAEPSLRLTKEEQARLA